MQADHRLAVHITLHGVGAHRRAKVAVGVGHVGGQQGISGVVEPHRHPGELLSAPDELSEDRVTGLGICLAGCEAGGSVGGSSAAAAAASTSATEQEGE